jgi:hypothetical protein
MKTALTRFFRAPAVRTVAFGALALTGAYALAQQMVGPQTKPPSARRSRRARQRVATSPSG